MRSGKSTRASSGIWANSSAVPVTTVFFIRGVVKAQCLLLAQPGWCELLLPFAEAIRRDRFEDHPSSEQAYGVGKGGGCLRRGNLC